MEFKFEASGIDEAIKQLQKQLDAMKDAGPEHRRALEQALESLRGQQGKFSGQWRSAPPGADTRAAAAQTLTDAKRSYEIGGKSYYNVVEAQRNANDSERKLVEA